MTEGFEIWTQIGSYLFMSYPKSQSTNNATEKVSEESPSQPRQFTLEQDAESLTELRVRQLKLCSLGRDLAQIDGPTEQSQTVFILQQEVAR